MEMSPELLQRFFAGRCSKEQEAGIRAWLAKHPEILEPYMTDQGWEQFQATGTIPPGASERMQRYLLRSMRRRTYYLRWSAAAAILVLLAGLAYFQMQQKAPAFVQEPAAMACVQVNNASFIVKNIKLPDGSQVALAPGSMLEYDSVFGARRDVQLSGNASFSVAKDHSKPFCVHTRNINVTALGTVFSVEDKDALMTSIRLLEGKVVVKKEAHVTKKMEAVFLKPGQELLFNNLDFSNKVRRFGDRPLPERPVPEQLSEPITTVLEFDNEPMNTVFKKIERAYHIKIGFNEAAVKDMRFTGTYRPSSETIEQFLNTLVLLNHLKMEKTTTGFLIRTSD
ncbi:FecR domain-containing protein [Niabella pedocola]|uniref:FecR domain-containing protein n=1 Tax=Niabella pedocola TaxID=1752077 RepID=A0ABS8PYS1_9BACT|nr:FecR domain-containing protein [Niabella pedocola]MCD2426208.1 FecR domain-containing protein [Niabella pedocola]